MLCKNYNLEEAFTSTPSLIDSAYVTNLSQSNLLYLFVRFVFKNNCLSGKCVMYLLLIEQ